MADTLMTHFIAGYPTADESLKVGKALIAGGASYLEMQIPYSDPTADGPVIAAACDKALEGGFRVDQAFDLCRELTGGEEAVPRFSYELRGHRVQCGGGGLCGAGERGGRFGTHYSRPGSRQR